MDFQTFLLFGVPAVVIVLTWLDFKPSGPRLVARLWARIQAPRRQREVLQRIVESWSAHDSGHWQYIQQLLGTQEQLMQQLKELRAENARLRTQVDGLEEDVANVASFVLTLAKRVNAESPLPESYYRELQRFPTRSKSPAMNAEQW